MKWKVIIEGLDSKDLRHLADFYDEPDLNTGLERLARNGIVPIIEDGMKKAPNYLIGFEKRSD